MDGIQKTELILNPDGSIYHLNLLPEDIADNVILVGDPGRVPVISSLFERVELKKQNREFVTHTGDYRGTRFTVISSGIGTDNIDIVLNELDALVNIDMKTRTPLAKHRSLNIVRIGTSGSLQKDIPADSFVLSQVSIGFDGLLNFYAGRNSICDNGFEKALINDLKWSNTLARPYVVHASDKLAGKFKENNFISGVTISAPGFYGPQGRELRLKLADPDLNMKIEKFRYGHFRITNYEMECSAIYGLSKLLGHEAVTVCAVIANRTDKTYSDRHGESMAELIGNVLDSYAL